MSKFAERLIELREVQGLSQNALAKALGTNSITISRWERDVRTPSIQSLEMLTKFFGVTAGYLIGTED